MKRRARTRGFTLIEVMMAVGIMTMGAVGIMALMQAATRGNANARQMTIATQNTQLWIDRLHRVSLPWVLDSQNAVATIPYLHRIASAQQSGWFVPDTAQGADGLAGVNWSGNPVSSAAAPREWRACTLLNLSWVTVGKSIRAEVITFFARGMADGVVSGTSALSCSGGVGATIVTELSASESRLSSVRAATLLRWRPM